MKSVMELRNSYQPSEAATTENERRQFGLCSAEVSVGGEREELKEEVSGTQIERR